MSKRKESKTMKGKDENQHLDSVATQHGIISLSTLSNLPSDYFQEANGGTAEQEPGSASTSSSSTTKHITSSVGRGNTNSDKRRKLSGRLVSLYESSGSSSDNSNSAEKIEDESTGSGRAGSSCSTSSSHAPPSSEDSSSYRDYSDANEAEFGMHSNTSG